MFTKNEKRIMNHIKNGCLDVTSLTQITNFKRTTIYAYLSNIKNINDNLVFIANDIINAKINVNGALNVILVSIWNACWTCVTSVVILVIILDVENLSIFSNE